MGKRTCFHCNKHLPPETDHFDIDGKEYCTDCVEVKPYTAYQYFLSGDYVGDSEQGNVELIEWFEDDYEEDGNQKEENS